MKKLIIALSLAAVSHFNVYAQLTQDAVIAMCPELPSEQDMIDWAWRPGAPEDNKPYYEEFHEALNKVREKHEEMKAKTHPNRKAEEAASKKKIEGTNVTVGQLDNMSDAQLKAMAKQAVKGRLGNLGVSMADLEAVQSGKMTEKELADKMMAKATGGLTVSDVEFIDKNNMSPEEIAQFMQMAGISEGVQAAAAKGKKDAATMAKVAPLQEKVGRLTRRLNELGQKTNKLRREARAEGIDLWNRLYKKPVETLEKELADLGIDEMNIDKELNRKVKIKEEQHQTYIKEYNSKYIPLWRNAIIACLNVVTTEMPPVYKELRDTYAELYKLTGDPQFDALSKLKEDIAEEYIGQIEFIDRYDDDLEEFQ